MGGSKDYLETGGFTVYKYEQIGVTANGIKIINDSTTGNTNTPMKSNTPYTAYAKYEKDTNQVEQITVYGGSDGRSKVKDIDFGHKHDNKQKRNKKTIILKTFSVNDIYVHTYSNGKRSEIARRPSKKERRMFMIARFGK